VYQGNGQGKVGEARLMFVAYSQKPEAVKSDCSVGIQYRLLNFATTYNDDDQAAGCDAH
jgi:hypothetical protein